MTKSFNENTIILELGVGTGLTGERILRSLPLSDYFAIDFSQNLLEGAMKRLQKYNTHFILEDYSKIKFSGKYNIIVSVIGIHHQNNPGKKKLFKKIFNSLNSNGIFIFGDLFTFKNQFIAAVNDAKHYHNLVENVKNEKSLKEWSHHHKFLNILASLEDQIQWLKEAGFGEVKIKYKKFNTVLLVAKK